VLFVVPIDDVEWNGKPEAIAMTQWRWLVLLEETKVAHLDGSLNRVFTKGLMDAVIEPMPSGVGVSNDKELHVDDLESK
jgi:hypothetical protein